MNFLLSFSRFGLWLCNWPDSFLPSISYYDDMERKYLEIISKAKELLLTTESYMFRYLSKYRGWLILEGSRE